MTDLDNLRVIKLYCQYLATWLAGIAAGIVAVTPPEELIWLVPEGIAIVLFVASLILTRMIDSMKLLEDLTWESERVWANSAMICATRWTRHASRAKPWPSRSFSRRS